MTCKNCGNNFEGKFCNECGQPAATHDMNFHSLSRGLLHRDKGLFFTIKELFKRPGHTIREYIEGRRVNHFKPISLILILAGTFGLLSHFFNVDVLNFTVKGTQGEVEGMEELRRKYLEVNDWVAGHYAFVTLLTLPIFAFGTYIGFSRKGYNFVEHLVLNAYMASQRLLLHIVSFPLLILFKEPAAQKQVNDSLSLVILIITFWTMFQFFDKLTTWSVLWRTAVGFLIAFIIYVSIGVIILYLMWSSLRLN